ncbi:SURF1 family protein [Pseudocolwellia agarivorans]|uniref:SURF1 family protein n=1 Tax=Pseudocolwellia agarivorans TaxID=1911682 RepID=UPI0009857F48|nr:SURF1 family protein [Pseudocolwellia agarivorans]
MKHVLSNIRLPWLIFTLLVFSALVKLGFWQSARAIEKEERLHNIAQLSQTTALSLSEIQKLPLTNINDFPIKLKGEFEKGVLFLLDNQTNNGQLGYRVYQIFNANNQSLLVNLGWIVGSINRNELPNVKAITGSFELNGHIRLIEKGILLMEQQFSNVSWPLRIQQVEIDKLSLVAQKTLLPFVVYVNEDESLGYKKNWQPIVMPPEKHRAYAFQWFSLAIVWLILMFWASIKFNKADKTDNNKTKSENNNTKDLDV